MNTAPASSRGPHSPEAVAGHRTVGIVLSGRLGGLLTAVAFFLVIPRLLGVEAYGYYSVWFAQLFLLFTFLDFGSSETILRYLPPLLTERSGQARALIRLVRLQKAVAIPFVLALVALYHNQAEFILIAAAAALAAYSYVDMSVLFASHRLALYAAFPVLRKLARMILLGAFFLIWGLPGIIAALFFTEVFIFVLYRWIASGIVPTHHDLLRRPARDYVMFGLLLFGSILLFLAIGRLPVILARVADLSLAQIGILALLLDIFFFAIRELFFGICEALIPTQVTRHSGGFSAQVAQTFSLALRLTLVLMLPSLLLANYWSAELLSLLGPEYAPAADYFPHFLASSVLLVLTFFYRQILFLYERRTDIFLVSVASALVFLATLAALVPLSVVDFSYSVLAACSTGFLGMRTLSRRALHVPQESYIAVRTGACGALLFLMLFGFSDISNLEKLLVTIVALLLYGVCLWLLRIIRLSEMRVLTRLLTFRARPTEHKLGLRCHGSSARSRLK